VFAKIGRAAIRWRWLVVATWLGAAAASAGLLPSISSVVHNDNSSFLPRSAPSVRALSLASPFEVQNQHSGLLVAERDFGPLTLSDQLAISAAEARVRRAPLVTEVRDQTVSGDDEARAAYVGFAVSTLGGGETGARAVDAARAAVSAGAPPGLSFHLTGPLPELVDQQSAASHTQDVAQRISVVLIIVLLLLAFRATLAPVLTLLPPLVALTVAGGVIAESTRIGVQISSLLQLLLTALVLGAGTDYGLFLIYRYRENLQRGMDTPEAIVTGMARVGESISFSAATVIAALLSLALASFGLYRGVGPGLAIGVAIVLLVDLTLLPALLAILGSVVFWPSRPRPGQRRTGTWGRVAARVVQRPVVALVAGTALLGGFASFLTHYAPSGFNPGGAIPGSDSAAGAGALYAHFGIAEVSPTDVVLQFAHPVWSDATVIDQVEDKLFASGEFSTISSALDPNGTRVSPAALAYGYRLFGPPQHLPPVPPSTARVPSSFYGTYRSTGAFLTADGRRALFRTSLVAGSPGSTAALQAIPGVRSAVERVARQAGAVRQGVEGQAAAAADVSAVSGEDIVRVVPVTLVVLAILLALVLRSLLPPLYLVASVGLSYLASMGLAVAIFVVVGGQLGVNFSLPFFLFVFIMALGEDYNILVMSRIREEAILRRHLPLRHAVAAALGTTGSTVTSAGMILAGTFAVVAGTTSGQIRQIGTGLALGVLLDTFIVRTLLVPSAAVLTGRWNWWPSRLWRTPGPGGQGLPAGAVVRALELERQSREA
jgi:RND superfamily putative drug exporter